MRKRAVLLLNLGSPDSTSTKDVRAYLAQFLMDERVLDMKKWWRALVVYGLILPKRPKHTQEGYEKVWTKEGAPLIVTTEKVRQALSKAIEEPVYVAMRYGKPIISSVVQQMRKEGVQEAFIIPLYPHYAMSSYETALVAAQEALAENAPEMRAQYLQPFYKDADYIQALVESARPYLEKPFDKLLFSFHGIPERHLRKSDPSRAHCLCVKNCCSQANPAHATCYKHQCLETVRHFVKETGLKENQYTVSFQSRLGRDPWIKPYTDETLESLPKEGVKRLLVICPAFVADCLETLEEIQMAGKESFLKAGGETFEQIPCLNAHPAWIQFLKKSVQKCF